MFQDRLDAGMQLAAKLTKYKNEDGIVLAVPRGGVQVAYVVAKELGFPMDLVLTKKIGHPANKEYAIGAASLTDYFVVPHGDVSEEYIQNELIKVRQRLNEMHEIFSVDKVPAHINGKTVIVIDDGIATGNTLLSTVNMLRKSNPAKIIIGVPVASQSAFQLLSNVADEIVAVFIPDEFYGVGGFYDNFDQVSDQEVLYYLDKIKK